MSTPSETTPRNIAIDAYRGFVMFLMMAEVLELSRAAKAMPDNWLLGVLAYHQSHVPWAGCSLHDTIQPGFSFLVGVAVPYSIASRVAKGGAFWPMFWHTLWRSLILVVLGVMLRPWHRFTLEDTLAQIGLGYTFLWLVAWCRPRWQWGALAVILFGYWLAWALYPAPGPEFASHWTKNNNLGHAFDVWFLNLFPRTQPFVANSGGYLTLSFIPTLGTMILGLAAGRWLRETAPGIPYRRLLIAGVAGIAAGLALHFAGICPVVKRIWTPSWTLFSGGICFLFLAGFCWLDGKVRRWLFPLVVIGMNSIAAYLIAHVPHGSWTLYGPIGTGTVILAVYWIILYWMYRRKVFLRI